MHYLPLAEALGKLNFSANVYVLCSRISLDRMMLLSQIGNQDRERLSELQAVQQDRMIFPNDC